MYSIFNVNNFLSYSSLLKLSEEEGKCASIKEEGSKQLQWEQCIKHLAKNLDKKCHGYGISKVHNRQIK